MKTAVSIFIWIIGAFLAFSALLSCLFFAVALFPFDRQRRAVHAQFFWLSDLIIGLSPFWRLNISGLENADKAGTYVIISNHQSMADIIIMYKTRLQFKWVAKESLYKVPFVNVFLLLGRFYKEAGEFLRNGMSLFFFPEGTRSRTGSLGKFQNGAFKMAIREKVPILPVFIEGSRNVLEKGSWRINAMATCGLRVLPPIDTDGMGRGDLARLKDMVHSRFEAIAV
jgi:1-acyl-sn-glycerol-3-phosphate acyltransferase